MGKHVFLSFVEEDLDLVNLFRGQAKNKNSDLTFDDYSVRVPFDSDDADYIRQKIMEKIKAASITVCLIGQTTHTSRWVGWEIRKSDEVGNRLLGVRLHSDSTKDKAPKALVDAGAKILNWDIDKIVDWIDEE